MAKRARKPTPIDPSQPLIRRPPPPSDTRPTPVLPTYAVPAPTPVAGRAGGPAPRPHAAGQSAGGPGGDPAASSPADASGERAPSVRRSEQGRRTAEAFGRRVAEYREARGWSQGELGRRTSLTQAAISHVEAGTRTPSIETARVIAQALGVSVGALMGERSAAVLGEEARVLALWRAAPGRVQGEVARYLEYLISLGRRGRPGPGA